MATINQQSPIIVRNLGKTFRGKRGRKVLALDDVSFTAGRGEVLGFLGPNGAGKSTVIKILMGMLHLEKGEILLCGEPAGAVSSRRYIGYLPENPAFYDFLSGREYLNFVASTFNMPKSEAEVAIDYWLDRLGLKSAEKRPIRSYSKGMVQRLGIAQALFHQPDVVIFDEPMSGLDPQGRALVKELILELKGAEKTVFFSTHITADVEKVCDRLAIIVSGQLRVDTRVENLMRKGESGYRIIARGGRLDSLPQASVVPKSDEYHFTVAPLSLPEKISQIYAAGGVVELVEPLHHDLEEFFLETVLNAS